MSYIVHFEGVGYTAPDINNPNGIRVRASGEIVINGIRPARSFDIPLGTEDIIKEAFMKQTGCVRFKGDTESVTYYPKMWLGKEVKEKPGGYESARQRNDPLG